VTCIDRFSLSYKDFVFNGRLILVNRRAGGDPPHGTRALNIRPFFEYAVDLIFLRRLREAMKGECLN
jgi:hypothetical protein